MFESLKVIPDVDELPPKSSLPWVWFGFFFVAAFLIEETLMVALHLEESVGNVVLVSIGLAGWIYWLFCVARFHTILQEVTRRYYPITGGEAALKHLIPFYGFYWMFRWPTTMSDYLNRRGRVQMISGSILGVFLLLSLLTARFVDGGIGLIGTFAVGMYISAKLNRHIELIAGTTKEALPPVLDPSQFRQTPAEPVTANLNTSSFPPET
jgi:hypothetical protein